MPTAKQAAVKHAHPPEPIKEERRAYEHLGRVEGLHPHLEKGAGKQIYALVDLAHQQMKAKLAKDAADLLRAAEHLSFGALHTPKKAEIHPKLRDEFKREFDHKLAKADEHWSQEAAHQPALEEIYDQVCKQARAAHAEENLCQALELARAVEALAHVKLPKADGANGSETA